MACECEFDPYTSAEAEVLGEESLHYRRTCEFCGTSWLGLHCPHDGYQNPCDACDKRPTVIPDSD